MGTNHVFIFVWTLIGLTFPCANLLNAGAPQQPPGSFPASSLTQGQMRSISVGFPRQQDPFGERQGQDVRPKPQGQDVRPKAQGNNNQFGPPVTPQSNRPKQGNDVFGEGQARPKMDPKTDPKTDFPVEPTKTTPDGQPQPAPTGNANTFQGDPFADPPTPNTTPQPNKAPELAPKQSVISPEPRPGAPEINPPAANRDTPQAMPQSSDPAGQPANRLPIPTERVRPTQPQSAPPTAGSLDYIRGRTRQEQPAAPAKVQWPPPAGNVPPLVGPNRFRPSHMPSQVYQPPRARKPLYRPDFQPIPGLRAQPNYVPSNPPPAAPGVYVPPVVPFRENLSGVVTPTAPSTTPSMHSVHPKAHSVHPKAHSVYEDSVVKTIGSGCSSCRTGCDSCSSGCPNFYVSMFGGYTRQRGLDGYSGSRQMSTDGGGGFGIALGRRNGRNLRTEAEFSFRSNGLTDFVTSPTLAAEEAPVSGELNAYGGMANAYWEFINTPSRCFKPYVGVGVGFVGINAVIRDPMSRNLVPSSAQTDTSFAYQWMGGLNYKAYRNLDVFVEYRMFNADTYRLDPSVSGLGDRYTFKTDNVFAGFRWKF